MGVHHNLPNLDLDEALAVHQALIQAVMITPGGRDDPQALAHFSTLCALAFGAVHDFEARALVIRIENLARRLCFVDGHVGVEAGSLSGVEALKLESMYALSSLHARLALLNER